MGSAHRRKSWTTRLILSTLGRALKTATPSYLVGKQELRNALMGCLRYEASQAEAIVDIMENQGALRFEYCEESHVGSNLRWVACF